MNSRLRARARAVLAIGSMVMAIISAATALAQNEPQSLREKLVQALETASQNQLQIVAINETQLSTIYEVVLNTGEMLYTDSSGDYLFAGDMYRTTVDGLLNLSSNTRNARNLEQIAAIPESEMIVFEPEETKVEISVFTDVDCTYCRALHGEIEDLLAMGIRVRYLAYPRGGMAAGSYDKMISVWCSDDRKKSLTQAKNGQNLPERDCDSPVMEHYELGNLFGISGTPAIVFPDGRIIPGYVDASRMAQMLGLN